MKSEKIESVHYRYQESHNKILYIKRPDILKSKTSLFKNIFGHTDVQIFIQVVWLTEKYLINLAKAGLSWYTIHISLIM